MDNKDMNNADDAAAFFRLYNRDMDEALSKLGLVREELLKTLKV